MSNGTVDVNLFVNAFSKGLNDGARVGTPFSNFTNSLVAGFDAERKAEIERQQIELNENKIEMLPAENAIREAEAARAKVEAGAINQDPQAAIQRKIDMDKATLAEKEAQAAKQQQEAQFQQILNSPPEVQQELYTSGKLTGILNSSPEKKNAFERLSINWPSADAQKMVIENRMKERVVSLRTEMAAQAEAKYPELAEKYGNNAEIKGVVEAFDNTDPLTFLEKGTIVKELVPPPRPYIDASGNRVIGVPPKDKWETKDIMEAKEGYVPYFDGKPKYEKTVSKETYNDFVSFRDAYRTRTGQIPSADESDAQLKKAQEEAQAKRAKQQEAMMTPADPEAAANARSSFMSNVNSYRPQPQNMTPADSGATMPQGTARPELQAAQNKVDAKKEQFRQKFAIKPKAAATSTPQAVPTVNPFSTPVPTSTPTPAPSSTFSPLVRPISAQSDASTPNTAARNTAARNNSQDAVVQRVNSRPELIDAPSIVKAVVAVESAGKANATSPTGVKGLMQVTRGTMQEVLPGGDVNNATDSVIAGSAYLGKLLGNKVLNRNPYLVLAAYNGGPGLIADAVRAAGGADWDRVKAVLPDVMRQEKYASFFKKNKISLDAKYAEIVSYPDKVLSYYEKFEGRSQQPAPVVQQPSVQQPSVQQPSVQQPVSDFIQQPTMFNA